MKKYVWSLNLGMISTGRELYWNFPPMEVDDKSAVFRNMSVMLYPTLKVHCIPWFWHVKFEKLLLNIKLPQGNWSNLHTLFPFTFSPLKSNKCLKMFHNFFCTSIFHIFYALTKMHTQLSYFTPFCCNNILRCWFNTEWFKPP